MLETVGDIQKFENVFSSVNNKRCTHANGCCMYLSQVKANKVKYIFSYM